MNRAELMAMFEQAPAHFPRGLLMADWFQSPIGEMLAVADGRALHLLEFVERRGLRGELQRLVRRCKAAVTPRASPVLEQLAVELSAYFEECSNGFQTPLARFGTPFQVQVWDALAAIPAGQTRTYSELAASAGRPDAVRAAARANGANQIAIIVPCHRVLGSDGSLTGYGGKLWRKRWLLEHEGALPRSRNRSAVRRHDPGRAAR